MNDYHIFVGKKINRLTVVSYINEKYSHRLLCKCECGETRIYNAAHVVSGHTKSCGCRRSDLVRIRRTTHGLTNHPLRNVMTSIYSRCYCDKHPSFENYGGRGIEICEEWRTNFLSFFEWAIRNGWEKGLQIDRIDNNLGYSPENCRIVTRKENARNRRDNVMITYSGQTKCLKDWSVALGVESNVLIYRLKKWSLEKAFTEPVVCRRKKSTKVLNIIQNI